MGCRYETLWSDLDLTFYFAVMTLTFKIFPRIYISETVMCRKLILDRDIG